jgi:HAD superfamily hydrolase (TIGR01549 family)
MPMTVVFFDIGETLVNERRLWTRWAAYLGVPDSEFLSALDDVILAGHPHRRVFDRFKQGFDLEVARRERTARGDPDEISVADLYPDVQPCLRALHDAGYRTGIAGNQPANMEASLKQFGLDIDFIASSSSLGAEKPSLRFFEALTTLAKVPAPGIAYVGDRLDNDVLPARQAGMTSVFLQRGPWGRVHARRPEAQLADLRIKSLVELPDALAQWRIQR